MTHNYIPGVRSLLIDFPICIMWYAPPAHVTESSRSYIICCPLSELSDMGRPTFYNYYVPSPSPL